MLFSNSWNPSPLTSAYPQLTRKCRHWLLSLGFPMVTVWRSLTVRLSVLYDHVCSWLLSYLPPLPQSLSFITIIELFLKVCWPSWLDFSWSYLPWLYIMFWALAFSYCALSCVYFNICSCMFMYVHMCSHVLLLPRWLTFSSSAHSQLLWWVGHRWFALVSCVVLQYIDKMEHYSECTCESLHSTHFPSLPQWIFEDSI